MQAAVGIAVKAASDQKHAELSSKEVYQAFVRQFVNISAPIELIDFDFTLEKTITVTIYLKYQGVIKRFNASANGHLDAVSNALHGGLNIPFSNLTYHEHAMGSGTDTLAILSLIHISSAAFTSAKRRYQRYFSGGKSG